jgi:hypothetical protein
MASAVQEVFGYYTSVAASTQATQLARRPLGGNVPAGAVIMIEMNFTSSGDSTGLGIEKWLFGVRYSANNVPSTASGDRVAERVAYKGSSLLTDAYAYGGDNGQLYLAWTPAAAGKNWTLRGHLWIETTD